MGIDQYFNSYTCRYCGHTESLSSNSDKREEKSLAKHEKDQSLMYLSMK